MDAKEKDPRVKFLLGQSNKKFVSDTEGGNELAV